MQKELGTIFPSVPATQQASGDRTLQSIQCWARGKILPQCFLSVFSSLMETKDGISVLLPLEAS